jgi:hypothetical protein
MWGAPAVAVCLALVLIGCGGPRLSGNETYVTVTPADDEAEALPIAQKHCGTYGRIAHFKRMEGKSAVFDCDLRAPG